VQVARRSDMDMNGHINNVTYLNWALETVPADVYLNFSLQQARRRPARAAAAYSQPCAAAACWSQRSSLAGAGCSAEW